MTRGVGEGEGRVLSCSRSGVRAGNERPIREEFVMSAWRMGSQVNRWPSRRLMLVR